MVPSRYEITFSGEAGPPVRAAFEEFDLVVEGGVTVLHAHMRDQAELRGVIDRIDALGLELISVTRIDTDSD